MHPLKRLIAPPGWPGFVISLAFVAFYQETRIEEQRQLVFMQEIQIHKLKEHIKTLSEYINNTGCRR